ncbi:hypothetical protein SH449x_003237 [Pirellulaceae bacterium SH449]
MSSNSLFRFGICIFLVAWMSFQQVASAQNEPGAADWLPKSTIAYVEICPAEAFLEHPIRKQIQRSTAFRKIWFHPNLTQVRVGLTAAEFAIGSKLESILKSVNHGGLVLAFDQETGGAVLLAKTEGETWLVDYLQKLKDLASSDAKSKKQPNPIEEKDYRDISATKFQEAIIAPLGPWLMVTNKPELAKGTIDRFLDRSPDSFSASESFQRLVQRGLATSAENLLQVTSSTGGKFDLPVGRMFVDLDALRTAGVAKELLSPNRKDFGAELLLGGLLAALQSSSAANVDLAMTGSGFSLNAQLASTPESLQESHAFFIGVDGSGSAPELLRVSDTVANIGAYRDISELWLRAGDLFDQTVNDQLAQADSTLTTLFSGKDFAEDILGAIEPQLQIVVAKTTRNDAQPVPAIRLPAFAIVGQLKDATKMRRELKRTFQSLIGFLNIVGAMDGQPQLELMSDGGGSADSQFFWAEYLMDADKKYDNGLPIQFNFTPCIAFAGERVAISSTVELAKQIFASDDADVQTSSPTTDTSNTNLVIDVPSIASLLLENRETLITNNILEKGHSRQDAEEEVELLFTVLSLAKELRAALRFRDGTELSIELDMQPEVGRNEK